MGDALDRTEQAFGVEGAVIDHKNLADRLIEWASANNVSVVVTPYAPVGPVRDLLDAAGERLTQHGIELLHVRRRYDDICWPHATRGYFKLKKKIPAILKQLGLVSS